MSRHLSNVDRLPTSFLHWSLPIVVQIHVYLATHSPYLVNGEELSNYVLVYPTKTQKSPHQASVEGEEGYGKGKDFEIHYDFENFLSEQNNCRCVSYFEEKREEEKRANCPPQIYLCNMLSISNTCYHIR